jgi:hypothetical protein
MIEIFEMNEMINDWMNEIFSYLYKDFSLSKHDCSSNLYEDFSFSEND